MAQVLGAAAVGPLAVEYELAHDPLFDGAEGRLDTGRGDRLVGGNRAGRGVSGGLGVLDGARRRNRRVDAFGGYQFLDGGVENLLGR